jgi:hypothetical protein
MGDINKVMIAAATIMADARIITPERQLLMDRVPMK